MYCKFLHILSDRNSLLVLIVAKCIVNVYGKNGQLNMIHVLIVAKCIVNRFNDDILVRKAYVLIVAKCIVNLKEANAAVIKIKY